MRKSGFTIIEAVVILVILGILAAILYPALHARPARFYTAVVPPQHFKNTELQAVIGQLDKALQDIRGARRQEAGEIFETGLVQ